MKSSIPLSIVMCTLVMLSAMPLAAQTVTFVQSGRYDAYWSVPNEVDPTDATQRILVLLPGGPLVVDATITIDGQPFQTHREQMITDLLEKADADNNGEVTWEEFLEQPQVAAGRYAYLANNKEARERTVSSYDENKDGAVDRYEARKFVAAVNNGPAFMLTNNSQRFATNQNSAIRELLDTDKDEVLDEKELAAAKVRLKSRDANDDDIVDLAELTGAATVGRGQIIVQRGGLGVQPNSQLVFHLSDLTDASVIATLDELLKKRYGKDGTLAADSFALTPKLTEQLDTDANGQVDQAELAGLWSIDPHVRVDLNLGESGELPAGITLRSVADDVKVLDQATASVSDTVMLDLPGVNLRIVAGDAPVRNYNLESTATALLGRYDTDKNGYIEKKEIGEQQGLVQQFAQWDANEDGKVFEDEIKQFYRRSQEAQLNRVSVAAAEQGDSLFVAIDTNGDGRLGLREIHEAERWLKLPDKNADMQLTPDEIPTTIRLAIARGTYAYAALSNQNRGGFAYQQQPNTPRSPSGPKWFIHMDRNGDGDLTRREFLGDEEQFEKLDTNGDGFIELKEAGALDGAKETPSE